jgi:hypothetical protein
MIDLISKLLMISKWIRSAGKPYLTWLALFEEMNGLNADLPIDLHASRQLYRVSI